MSCYVYRNELSEEEIKEIYKKQIEKDSRFISEVDIDHIAVTSGFIVYPFLDGAIKNLDYLVIRKGHQQSGTIDVSCSLMPKDFALRELMVKDFIFEEKEISEYAIFNLEDIEFYEKEFIKRILDKTTKHICKRHNLILTDKSNEIDIAPIKTFEELKKRYYLEQVFYIDYFSKRHRKPFRSVYAPLKQTFYSLNFITSDEFNQYLKFYKHPIVSIPKEYYDLYYSLSFQVYLDVTEELKYIKPLELLTKAKKNIKYKEYSKYDDYLNELIFYFRKREYLKEYPLHKKGLKEEIFYCYLTLRHNPQSGYRLAELVENNIVFDQVIPFLSISAKLGNTLAKKALYEYYSEPKNYNAYYVKRYS